MKFKYLIISMGLFMCSPLAILAQSEDKLVNKATILQGNEVRDAWSVTIDPAANEVKKAWKNFMEDNFDADVDGYGLFSKDEVLTVSQVSIPNLSDHKVDIYLQSIEQGSGSKVSIFGRNGEDQYWTGERNAAQFTGLKDLFNKFLEQYLMNYHGNVVSDVQDGLNDLYDDRDKLQRNIEKNKDDIMKMEREIIELKQENEISTRELEKLEQDIQQSEQNLKKKQTKAGAVKNKF